MKHKDAQPGDVPRTRGSEADSETVPLAVMVAELGEPLVFCHLDE